MIKHWLYKEIEYKMEIEKETDCSSCFHNVVCNVDKEKRCVNFEWGHSNGAGCGMCVHQYPRWDSKQPVPCFHCKDYVDKNKIEVVDK